MSSLYKQLRRRRQLTAAWRQIRKNGLASSSPETRRDIQKFDQDEFRNIERLQEQLQKQKFVFAPQKGIAAKKKSSNARRPLVVSPIENRIIQRAILDVAQEQVPAVKEILATPTSIGGIPNRGVGHAIALIRHEMENGAKYFLRSDISGFFTKIPRSEVVDFMRSACDDDEFTDLFEASIVTQLSNIDDPAIRDHRDMFPIGPTGVAQGSPLSPLIGNILLNEFDTQMNGRGIRCIRYIDDFILIGDKPKAVRRTFQSARKHLEQYDMTAYEPARDPNKAEEGDINNSFDFLGYQISPGLIMPSKSARQKIEARVESILSDAKGNLRKCASEDYENATKFRYAQTLKYLNDVIKGWAFAFQFSNSSHCMREIDKKIDSQLEEFNRFVSSLLSKADEKTRRRIIGVFLLEDLKPRPLPKIDD